MSAQTAPETLPSRNWDKIYLVLYLLYLAIGLLVRIFGEVPVDAVWYVNAARRVLDGSFDLYSFKLTPGIAPPEGLAFSYSPLVAMVVAPVVGVIDALGLGDDWANRLSGAPWLLVDVLAMHELRRFVRTRSPRANESYLFLGIVCTLGLTGLWTVSALRGHHEGMVLLCLLLTLRFTPYNTLVGGLCAGLALAAKQTALLYLVPVGFVLLSGKVRAAITWTAAASGLFLLFMLPALLRNFEAVRYAFLTQEARRITLGPGLPAWLDRSLGARATEAHSWLLSYSNLMLVVATVGLCAVAVWWQRARDPITLLDHRLLALVAFAGIAQIVLGKWVSGHYYQLPLAMVFLWDMTRTARMPTSEESRDSYIAPTSPFPWLGIGSAIAFRSVTQLDPQWLKDLALLALFVALAGTALRDGAKMDNGRRMIVRFAHRRR